MTETEYARCKRLIQSHEGRKLRVYDDATGKVLKKGDTLKGTPTIGYGHNLVDRGLTEKQAEALLDDDLMSTESALWEKLPILLLVLSGPRRAVLTDMAFCLGVKGVLQFKKMLKALAQRDYEQAAREILQSQFAAQTKTRARRLAKMMRTGEYPPHNR